MSDSFLKPCPFCGREPKTHSYCSGGKSYALVRCEACRLEKELHTDGESLQLQGFALDGVLHWWNSRSADEPTREQRTKQPLIDSTITVDVALYEAERCRRYSDPVLNEAVIVVLADEVLRLQTFGGNER